MVVSQYCHKENEYSCCDKFLYVSEITLSSAMSGGHVTIDNGGADVISRGLCWDTNPTPVIKQQ